MLKKELKKLAQLEKHIENNTDFEISNNGNYLYISFQGAGDISGGITEDYNAVMRLCKEVLKMYDNDEILLEIEKEIEKECISYGEIEYLQDHVREIKRYFPGEPWIWEWAGIPEEEYNTTSQLRWCI